MQPPRDRHLRAIWLVGRCNDLSATERLALLALWRYLGPNGKAIGPTLLAALLGTTKGYAKKMMFNLKVKGYIGSTGKQSEGCRRSAIRWLTKKVKWPRPLPRGNDTTKYRYSEGTAPDGSATPLPHGSNDYVVGHAGATPQVGSPPPQDDGGAPSVRPVPIADLLKLPKGDD